MRSGFAQNVWFGDYLLGSWERHIIANGVEPLLRFQVKSKKYGCPTIGRARR